MKIQQLEDGLFVSESTTEKGTPIYFALEKGRNRFWSEYSDHTIPFCRFLGDCVWPCAVGRRESPQYPDGFSQFFESEESYKKGLLNIARPGALEGLGGGAAGFSSMCDGDVAYVSKAPIVKKRGPWDKNYPDEDFTTFKNHIKNTSDILMVVGFSDNGGAPTTTHFGIFRNPISYFDTSGKYTHMAMPLHAFLAQYALSGLREKRYMVTSPLLNMVSVIAKHKCFKESGMHVGRVEDYARSLKENKEEDEDKTLQWMKKYPPILTENNQIVDTANGYRFDNPSKLKLDSSGINMSFPSVALDLPRLAMCDPTYEIQETAQLDDGQEKLFLTVADGSHKEGEVKETKDKQESDQTSSRPSAFSEGAIVGLLKLESQSNANTQIPPPSAGSNVAALAFSFGRDSSACVSSTKPNTGEEQSVSTKVEETAEQREIKTGAVPRVGF